MLEALSVVAVVVLFLVAAIVLSRRSLHRSLGSMPPLAGERTLAEHRGATLVHHKGGGAPSQVTYPGCTVRVTTARLLVAQASGERLLSVVLAPGAVPAMRAVDAPAIDRALKSFSIGVALPGSLAPTPSGGLSLSFTLLGPAVAPPTPPRWELPAACTASLEPALREAGLG